MMQKIIDKVISHRIRARFVGVSWRDLAITLGPILLLSLAAIWAAIWFVRPAPPTALTITAGPEDSTFRTTAEKYRKILARDGVKLQILPSEGSLENLRRLSDPKFHVDIGFVQGGVAAGMPVDKLISLGSVFHEPLAVFYRGSRPVERLSAFSGKRVAIGHEGSGAHALALILLKANGIETGGATTLLAIGGEDAAQALIEHKVDAAFLMGDSASPPMMRKLLWTPGIRLLNFKQAEAYSRRYPYLNKLDLPMGAIDLGKNTPGEEFFFDRPDGRTGGAGKSASGAFRSVDRSGA